MEWQSKFQERILIRGYNYYLSGAVEDLKVYDDHIESIVEGTEEYEVVIQSKILSYIPYTTEYIEDSTLAEGKEVIEQYGHDGCKSEAYKILKKNGKVVSETLLSKDTYSAMERIVRIGTKKN